MYWTKSKLEQLVAAKMNGATWNDIATELGDVSPNNCRKSYYRAVRDSKKAQNLANPPKVLILDIETLGLHVKTWSLGQQYITPDRVVKDWAILSWSAKWMGAPEKSVMYADNRNEKDPRNDKKIVKQIWDLMDEADYILTQNGKRFDERKLNSRFLFHKLGKPSHYEHIDALKIAQKYFGEASNSLAFVTKKFCSKYKKSGHKKFPGNSLWDECEAGNKEAFQEMEDYNRIDVLSLEEWYVDHLMTWDEKTNFNVHHNEDMFYCRCGSASFTELKPIPHKKKPIRQIRCKVCKAVHKVK